MKVPPGDEDTEVSMKILYRTNLDEAKPFVHRLNEDQPEHILPVGTVVRFPIRDTGFQLVVVGHYYDTETKRLSVELHLQPGESIQDFIDRMRRLRGLAP